LPPQASRDHRALVARGSRVTPYRRRFRVGAMLRSPGGLGGGNVSGAGLGGSSFSTYYEEPHEVVVDSSLSKAQKVEALNTLEQDARQLAEASSEGMGGGERNKLHDVLIAEDVLASPPVSRDRKRGGRQPLRPTRGDDVV
jgi:hypothetical protein